MINKRRLIKYGVLSALVYGIVISISIPAVTEVPYEVILGAHRGDSVEYIENTKSAIQAAVDNPKYQFIEFDVRFTKDRKPVVFHDSTLLRTQRKLYKLEDLTYEELLDLSDYHIPLYEEVIDAIGDTKKINVEIKSTGDIGLDGELVDFVVRHARDGGYLENVMISSISRDVVRYVSKEYPMIKSGQVFFITSSAYFGSDTLTNRIYDEVNETGADYLLLHGLNIRNLDNLLELKPEEKTIAIWYFNNEIYIVKKDETDGLW